MNSHDTRTAVKLNGFAHIQCDTYRAVSLRYNNKYANYSINWVTISKWLQVNSMFSIGNWATHNFPIWSLLCIKLHIAVTMETKREKQKNELIWRKCHKSDFHLKNILYTIRYIYICNDNECAHASTFLAIKLDHEMKRNFILFRVWVISLVLLLNCCCCFLFDFVFR